MVIGYTVSHLLLDWAMREMVDFKLPVRYAGFIKYLLDNSDGVV